MRQVWRVLLTAALLLAAQTAASAWDDTGHMVVAQIAYDRLNPRAKERVDALTKTIRFCNRTYDGVTIGDWMDDLKSDSTHDDLREWHYMDIPFFDGLAPDPSVKIPENNVVTRIKWATELLRKGTGSDKKDAELLGYLFHLVGDLHQPLHAVSRFTAANPKGDDGGNKFKLAAVPEVANLHQFWDSAAGAFFFWQAPRPMEERTRRRFNDYVQAVLATAPADKSTDWQVSDPQKWAQESYDLARTVVYALPENSTPSAAYTERARTVSRQRLALAGYRLAQLLNSLYPETAPK